MAPSLRVALGMGVLTLFAAGCTVGPAYRRPPVTVPEGHRGAPTVPSAESIADRQWFELFEDPVLAALVRDALEHNPDVRVAAARVEQARARAGITRSEGVPQAEYQADAGRAKPQFGEPTGSFDAHVAVSWELDLWGRIRRLNESALAQFLATEEARRGVMISLVSEVATTYFQLREQDEELEIARRTAAALEETAALFRKKLEGGAASALETSRAEGALHSVSVNVPLTERSIAELENRLSVLLGRVPGPVVRGGPLDTRVLPPAVPAGLPSALLQRRPDIRQAEQAIVAANAQVGVAQAGYFPTISLTGLLGGVSNDLASLFSEGRRWNLGVEVMGPLFTGGRTRHQKALALAQWDEARVQYESAVNTALAEVATGLMAHEKLAEAEARQVKAVAAYKEAVRLANLRYTTGLSAYFEVIDAQQLLFPVELRLASVRRDRMVNYVQLYQALGGGWPAASAQP